MIAHTLIFHSTFGIDSLRANSIFTFLLGEFLNLRSFLKHHDSLA
jgi:hypothetical protein